MKLPLHALAAPALLLAGCGDDVVVDDPDDSRSASGEILEGSISDAMIPAGSLQSQPPLLRQQPQPEVAEDAAVEGAGSDGDDAPATAAPVTPQPAAEPVAE